MSIISKINCDGKRVYYVNFNTQLPICACEVGWEITKPSHTWSPNGRPRYLIHLIKGGKGSVERENGTITSLSKGDCFINRPNENSTIKSDANEPFEYYWIAFNGSSAEKILNTTTNSLYPKYKESGIIAIRELLDNLITDDIGLLSALFSVLNSIKDEVKSDETDFIKKAVLYIENSYYKHFDVGRYAKEIGVSRSYFTTTFTQRIGVSPYNFLIKTRIENAKKYLIDTHMSISQIAYKVGFTALDRFSRMFKSYTTMSPLEFRNSKISIT